MSVLIIEDDVAFLELICHSLNPRPVRFACTYEEAKRKMIESAPDVVLLDLSLPDSSPAETIKRIRDIKELSKDATVIVITGNPYIYSLHNEAVRQGADCVLSKDHGFFETLEVALIAARKRQRCASLPTIELIERTVEKIVGPK
jgi:DNA-binding NarL/FixJ family response regulator